MVKHYLDFEKPLIDLEREIEHLRRFSSGRQVPFNEHLRNLEEKLDRLQKEIFSIYSVISPEGCAAILWKDGGKGKVAAESLKLTANDLYRLGVIDEVIKEPLGGAHRDPQKTAEDLREAAERHLGELERMDVGELLRNRYEKFRRMGIFIEDGTG